MTLEFSVTYAGIPFTLDQGKVVRIAHKYMENDPAPLALPPLKHQPLADLLDEIDRIYPLCYIQDFSIPGDFQGRNIDSLATLSKIGPFPNPQMKVNSYYYPTGASRWSVFRGLATSAMVKAFLAVTNGTSSATFEMEQVPITPTNMGAYLISTQLYMLPPRPLAEHGAGFDGLYLVTLVDERYYFQGTPASLTVRQDTQWTDLLLQLGTALGVTINLPTIPAAYGQPEKDSQLWSRYESAPALLDALAANLGRVVVRNLDRTYDLLSPSDSQTRAVASRGNAATVTRTAGGDFFTSGTNLPVGNLTAARNAVVPSRINITFPKYVLDDDPVPHLVNERYQVQRPSTWYEDSRDVYTVAVPIASGGGLLLSGQFFASGTISGLFNPISGLIGVSDETIHDTAKSLYSGEIALSGPPLNVSGLTSLALQIAGDFYGQRVIFALDETYPGIFAWNPEGLHDLVWTYSARTRQAVTRVLKTQWNNEVREMQHATPPPLSGFTNTPRGVGGPSVAQTWRDSFDGSIGAPLAEDLLSGALTATFAFVDYLPTQNRWRGQIDNEVILFEGTSGGGVASVSELTAMIPLTDAQLVASGQILGEQGWFVDGGTSDGTNALVTGGVLTGNGEIEFPGATLLNIGDEAPQQGTLITGDFDVLPDGGILLNNIVYDFAGTPVAVPIVYRAIDGTLPASHRVSSGAFVRQLTPDTQYGANLFTGEKMQFVYPSDWTSGGVQGVNFIPQTQTVIALDKTGRIANGLTYYSGIVQPFDPTRFGANQFQDAEEIWIVERNNQMVTPGNRYDGQFVGHSVAGPVAPVYAVNAVLGGGTIASGMSGPVTVFPPIYPPFPVGSGAPSSSGRPEPFPSGTYKAKYDTNKTINSFPPGQDGQLLYVWNTAPGSQVTINNLGGGAGQILTPSHLPYALFGDNGLILEYDGQNAVWRFDTPDVFGPVTGTTKTPGQVPSTNTANANTDYLAADRTWKTIPPNADFGVDIHGWHHAGNWYGWFLGGIISGAEGASPTIYFACPFLTTRPLIASNIGIQAGNNDGVTHNIRLAIYSNTSASVLYPKALLFDSGNIGVAPSGGALAPRSAVCGTALPPTLYWLVLAADDANIDFQSVLIPAANTFIYGLLGATSLSNTLQGGWTVPVAGFGAFLAAFPDIGGATPTQGCPFVMLQV